MGGYKFAFNGQMKDDEIYGPGNAYSAQYWEYDARLGRRWNLDPVDQISISNYATFANNPIANVDPDGNIWWLFSTRSQRKAAKIYVNTLSPETQPIIKNLYSKDIHVYYTTEKGLYLNGELFGSMTITEHKQYFQENGNLIPQNNGVIYSPSGIRSKLAEAET